MAKHARDTVKLWKITRAPAQQQTGRQGRRKTAAKATEESVLAEARDTEDPECIRQWDAGNKQMAKRAAKAAVQEAIATEAKELAVQGEWFRLSAKAKSDGQWGQVVKRMKEETREWCTKAALRAKCGKPATDAHVLNGCELALPRYTWRHNGVLCGL